MNCQLHSHVHLSVKQSWEHDIYPKPIMQTTVECAKDEKEYKKVAVTCTLYEARDEVAQELSASDIIAFEASLEPSSHLLSILPEEDIDVTFTSTQFWLAPKSSVLSYQLSFLPTLPDNQPPVSHK